jgi:hypothetical protein
MSTLNKAIFAIDNMEDLREVMNACNVRFRELQARAAHSFSRGDSVSFVTKSGQKITGVVTKVNQKTVSVKTATSEWKVSGSLLRKA